MEAVFLSFMDRFGYLAVAGKGKRWQAHRCDGSEKNLKLGLAPRETRVHNNQALRERHTRWV